MFDDVDRAGEEQLATLGELAAELAGLPVLVLATTENPALADRAAQPTRRWNCRRSTPTVCAPWRSSMPGGAMT